MLDATILGRQAPRHGVRRTCGAAQSDILGPRHFREKNGPRSVHKFNVRLFGKLNHCGRHELQERKRYNIHGDPLHSNLGYATTMNFLVEVSAGPS